MLELASWARPAVQSLADTLAGLPGWAAAVLLAVPVLMALFTGSRAAMASAALLALAATAFLAAGPSLTLAGLGAALALAGSLAAALAGFGEREQRARQAELEERLDHVHRQVMVFLEALDRRQSEIDRTREETRRAAENLRKLAAANATPPPPAPPPQP